MCLESLLHHASVEKYAHDIVQLNGLPLLMELHNRFKNNTAISVVLCRIISYMSVFPSLLDPIFKSGKFYAYSTQFHIEYLMVYRMDWRFIGMVKSQ